MISQRRLILEGTPYHFIAYLSLRSLTNLDTGFVGRKKCSGVLSRVDHHVLRPKVPMQHKK